jgi:hypothetical protein|tara:strand:+ start:620 stop:817 length:198 start_codon:yes stop_codon:yes gene_type:complete
MIDKLYSMYDMYIRKYKNFPVVTRGLPEDMQNQLAKIIKISLDQERELTKKEIQIFQDNDINTYY